MVRFDRGGIVDDGDGTGPRVVSTDEADRLEAEAVAGLGIHPEPAALGLPNCPGGSTARRLWEGASISEDTERPDVLPTGVAAELLGRELVRSDLVLRETVIARHLAALDVTASAITLLVEVLEAAEAVGILPVVVGSVAQAFDGPLPAHFTDVTRIDLLVRAGDVEMLADQLEGRGFEIDQRTLSGSLLSRTSDRRMRHPARPSILIDLHRTLAAGPFGELVDPEEFHRRAVPFRLGPRWALALHPEHRFVHECVRTDRRDPPASTAELRNVILSAPWPEASSASTMECAARWGAATSVLAVVRMIDARLPGLPWWLVELATIDVASSRRPGRRGWRPRG